MSMRVIDKLRNLEVATRPVSRDMAAALRQRWDALPEHVKTPAQLLGQRSTGCEGTHGVFPACDFACKPCYHSADANKVRVDGDHTRVEVERQMAFLAANRSPQSNAQLIGGEVTLLSPEDHAATVDIMRRHRRMPMSFTHGDVSEDHIRAVELRSDGTPRHADTSWAVHIDTTMFGRTGAEKPTSELQLDPFRQRFIDVFHRLRRETGQSHYIAHNMTVTPANLAEVAGVVERCKHMGYRMFSFQPAAFVGNEIRWRGDYRHISDDDVWREIERGVGRSLPYKAIQFGDLRCNRVVWGAWVGDRYVPLLDEDDPRDLAARDTFYRAFPGNQIGVDRRLVVARIARRIVTRPQLLGTAAAFARRFVKRAGGLRTIRRDGVHATTYVMHNFIDAEVVGAAWDLLRVGTLSGDARVRATQERLQACAYTMGHPETGEMVPACVQHSVLDPDENKQLATVLPLPSRKRAAS
jgi:hypothetical protein